MFDPLVIDSPIEKPDIGQVRIPTPLTPMLGRDRELVELVAILRRPDARLVSVTGPGGVGKTRLATEAALRLRDVFDGGQFFVSLDKLGDASQVTPIVLDVLRDHCAPDATTVTEIAHALGEKRVLMILNAAELVIEARTDVIRILEHLPSVTVLVASRVPLRVRGEQEYPICCLPLPEPGMSLPELRDVPSVQLFVERARSVRPTFDLTEGNRADVIEVVRQLDGLPVAIELAALRSRLFPVGVIRQRMDSLLDFLSGGPHDLPSRLQSMRSVIQWGYDILRPDDQRAFRTLSVFENAFSFMAASALLADEQGERLPVGEVMDILTHLLDASFIGPVQLQTNDAGYRMSTTTREFGREKLLELGEHEAVRERELAFYLGEFDRHWHMASGPELPVLLARIDFFSNNLHNALRVARRDKARVRDALRVATYMATYWLLRGNVVEGAEMLEAFLELAVDAPDRDRADASRQLGALSFDMNRLEEAHEWHTRALQLYEGLGDLEGIANSWNNLGVVAMRMGDIESAHTLLFKALEARKEGSDAGAHAQVLSDLGDLAMHEGDAALAVRRYEEAYAIHVDQRNRLAVVCDCVNLLTSVLLRDQSSPPDGWYERGTSFADDIRDWNGKAQLQLAHGIIELRVGVTVESLEEIADALRVIRESGSARLMLEALPLIAEVCVRLGDDRLAAQIFGATSRMGFGPDRFAWYRGKRQARALEKKVASRLGEGEFTRFTMLGAHQSIEQPIDAVLDLIEDEVASESVRDGGDEDGPPEEIPQLTGRERQVLALVAQGLSDKMIAEALRISPRTAMTHVSNIMTKMQVHSRSAASEFGIRVGLIAPPRDGNS